MNFKPIYHKYKKIQPICRNINHKCNCHCHCHKNIKNNNASNHLLILEDNNLTLNREKNTKLNIIKTEKNNNIIKSFVIYKNQIKPLFFSKINKNSEKNPSNLKKNSYGGNQLRNATITNNHSYKEIIGRSHSKSKVFKKSRVINYVAENNEYNEYNNNKNNTNIIKDIEINERKIKNSFSQIELYINTDDLDNNKKENKYKQFIKDLNSKLNNNHEKNYLLRKNETETNNTDNNYQNNNLKNNNINFRYYYDYKKQLIEKKKNIIKSKSNSYMKFSKNYPPNRINANYEDLKLKIKLSLMRKFKCNNNEINKNKMDIKYILLEKTKKILEDKNKNNYKKYVNKIDIFEDKKKKRNNAFNN